MSNQTASWIKDGRYTLTPELKKADPALYRFVRSMKDMGATVVTREEMALTYEA